MIFHWNMDPIAFTIPLINTPVRWYGILFALGFLIGYFLVDKYFKKKGYPSERLDTLLIYMFLGTVIGARIGHCFFYQPDYYLSNPLEIIKIWKGGLASHGGGIGLIISVLIFCKKYGFNFLPLADLLCIPTAFEGMMIRSGNFMNSEIFGKATNGEFGIIFDRLSDNVVRHPVQLYEAISYLVITLILLALFRYVKRGAGFVLGMFLILIFSTRIVLENYKPEQADYNENADALMTVGQYLSIPFIVAGVILVICSFVLPKLKEQGLLVQKKDKV